MDALRGTGPRGPGALVEHDVVAAARMVAGELLQQLDDGGRRWQHTRAVAARAAEALPLLPPEQGPLLLAAAWLHDVGYSPRVARSGFHPVDGAAYVRVHLPTRAVAGLIAQHSGARFLADARGLNHLMHPFARREYWTGVLPDALTWADQTTGPDGRPVTVEERLAEMLDRHGPDSPNARANVRRAPQVIAAVRATEARLAASGSYADRSGSAVSDTLMREGE